MRKLFLIRHGESAAAAVGKTDFDRQLTGPGIEQISVLGLKIRSLVEPDTIFISSTARRTIETTQFLISNSAFPVHFESRLYQGTAEDYLEVIEEYTYVRTLVLIGHNPAISTLTYVLTHNAVNFFPGTCVQIEFPITENQKLISGTIASTIHPEREKL
jgi:phosphohistidine phosphatase